MKERRLTLSRIGCISSGFHFLGTDYPGTQTRDSNPTRNRPGETTQYHHYHSWFTIMLLRNLRRSAATCWGEYLKPALTSLNAC